MIYKAVCEKCGVIYESKDLARVKNYAIEHEKHCEGRVDIVKGERR